MAAYQVALCALAVFAFVQVSSGNVCPYNYGCSEPIVVDVEYYCAPKCYDYNYDCGYPGYYYGYGGYPGYYDCGYPYYYGKDDYYDCCDCCYCCYDYYYDDCYGGYPYDCCDCCYEPFTEITTVTCCPVVETYIKPGYPYDYGYGGNDCYYGGGYDYPYGYGCYGYPYYKGGCYH